jgi:hypothetical protein
LPYVNSCSGTVRRSLVYARAQLSVPSLAPLSSITKSHSEYLLCCADTIGSRRNHEHAHNDVRARAEELQSSLDPERAKQFYGHNHRRATLDGGQHPKDTDIGTNEQKHHEIAHVSGSHRIHYQNSRLVREHQRLRGLCLGSYQIPSACKCAPSPRDLRSHQRTPNVENR